MDDEMPMQVLLQSNVFCEWNMICYLGRLLDRKEDKEHVNNQGIKLLTHWGVIPQRFGNHRDRKCFRELQDGTVCGQPYLSVRASETILGWKWKCRNGHRREALHNTILDRVRLRGEFNVGIFLVFALRWLNHEPAGSTQQMLKIGSDTSAAWTKCLNIITSCIVWHEYTGVGGPGDIVEIGEAVLLKTRSDNSEEYEDIWVFCGVSRTTKTKFVIKLEDRSQATKMTHLETLVDGRSFICADDWGAYSSVNRVFVGSSTVKGAREKNEWVPTGRFNESCVEKPDSTATLRDGFVRVRYNTRLVKNMIQKLKACTRTCNSKNLICGYLDSFLYEENIVKVKCTNELERFQRLMCDISRVFPGTGKKGMVLKGSIDFDITKCECHECEKEVLSLRI